MASDNFKVLGTVAIGVVVAAFFLGGEDSEELAATAAETSTQRSDPAPSSETDTAPPSTSEPRSAWRVREAVSQMDDSRSVYLSTPSNERIPGRFGRSAGNATLYVRCVENTTALVLQMNGNHMASSPYHDWGRVQMRINDSQAFTKSMRESTDNRALGLWNGGESIPVIRRMFGADLLTLRATPYSESPITMTFDITGLEETIAPLREACHW